MEKYGLVLAGGGAKGAYQMGVWRAMRELKADKLIGPVSGTSIGGINAALFVAGDFDRSMTAWNQVRSEDILSEREVEETDGGYIAGLFYAARRFFEGLRDGFFSRRGLLELIRENTDYDRLSAWKYPVIIAAFNVSTDKVEYFDLRSAQSSSEAEDMLLATSALPLIYGKQRIGEQEYVDGGLGDNCPVRPLYNQGVRKFIVVRLSSESDDDIADDRKAFPEALIINIVPSAQQGGIISGTLDFSKKGIEGRMELGYNDAMRALCTVFTSESIEVGACHVANGYFVLVNDETKKLAIKNIKKLTSLRHKWLSRLFGR